MNHDRSFYVTFNDFGAKIGIGETVVSDRKELVENIRRGELGFENVVAVHSYNPVEGYAVICTDDVLADVEAEIQRLQDREDFPLSRFADAAE
jgi:hypothetical protein